MGVARVTELSAISERGLEDTIEQAVARANQALGAWGCWVKDVNVTVEDGDITGCKVNVEIHLCPGG